MEGIERCGSQRAWADVPTRVVDSPSVLVDLEFKSMGDLVEAGGDPIAGLDLSALGNTHRRHMVVDQHPDIISVVQPELEVVGLLCDDALDGSVHRGVDLRIGPKSIRVVG